MNINGGREEDDKMSSKALKYLNNSINQDKLFNSIDEDIREIIKPYKFKKVVRISSNIGVIKIELQDPIPTSLIKELDEYMGLEALLEKDTHCINLIYNLTECF